MKTLIEQIEHCLEEIPETRNSDIALTIEKKCTQCSKSFTRRYRQAFNDWEKQKFCERACYFAWEKENGHLSNFYTNAKIRKICKTCSKGFTTFKSLDRVEHCSQSCAKIGKPRPVHVRRKISENSARYWLGKKNPYSTGEKNHNWKGGISRQNKSLRNQLMQTIEYKNWRREIMVRDDYTCQFCRRLGGKLEVDHHPFAYSTIVRTFKGIETVEDLLKIPFLFDIENGRTLCKECHKKYGNKQHLENKNVFQIIR